MGYTVLSIDLREISKQELIKRFQDQDVVFWWNWDTPNIQPYALAEIRKSLPKDQTWCLFNWDDPHVWSRNAPEIRKQRISKLAELLDLVYTTGSSTIAKYQKAGAKIVRFAMVPYSDIFHHFDPDPKYACDINFVATNYYDDFEGLSSSRRAIVEALTAAKDIDTAIYGLDPGRSENRDAFKGPIRFEINRKVFSSCKLTLNLLVAPAEECGAKFSFTNDRLVAAMASGA
jgi:hypothetical protein